MGATVTRRKFFGIAGGALALTAATALGVRFQQGEKGAFKKAWYYRHASAQQSVYQALKALGGEPHIGLKEVEGGRFGNWLYAVRQEPPMAEWGAGAYVVYIDGKPIEGQVDVTTMFPPTGAQVEIVWTLNNEVWAQGA